MVPTRPGPDASFSTRLKWWRWCFLTWFAGMPREGLIAAAQRPTTPISVSPEPRIAAQTHNSARLGGFVAQSEDPAPVSKEP